MQRRDDSKRTRAWLAVLFALGCAEDPTTPGAPNPRPADAGAPADTGVVAADAAVTPDGAVTPDAGFVGDAGVVVTSTSRVELGSVMLGMTGDSDVVRFDLPAGTTTFTVVIAGPADGTFIVKTMTGPNGTLVTDDDSNVSAVERFVLGPFAAQFKSPNRVMQDDGVAAALFPNNPGAVVTGGSYEMVIAGMKVTGNQGAPYATAVDITVHFKTQLHESGRVDVHIYLTGAGQLSAATAPTTPLVVDTVARLRTIYEQADLHVATVSYHDVDPSFQTIEAFGTARLGQLFQLTEGMGAGMHYFLIDRFEGGLGGGVGGIAGGIPGPPLWPGTVNAGVAVALSAAMGSADTLAHIMAHEGGHWLGLFHTSEITGTTDQLPDTPEGQAGNTHLMYPAVGGGAQISGDQRRVILHNIEVGHE